MATFYSCHARFFPQSDFFVSLFISQFLAMTEKALVISVRKFPEYAFQSSNTIPQIFPKPRSY